MHYKAPDNSQPSGFSLHFLDDGVELSSVPSFPSNAIAITDAEADALRPKPPAPSCQQQRAPLYPPYQDYLDGVVKGDQAQIQKYINDCLAVKKLIPKD